MARGQAIQGWVHGKIWSGDKNLELECTWVLTPQEWKNQPGRVFVKYGEEGW